MKNIAIWRIMTYFHKKTSVWFHLVDNSHLMACGKEFVATKMTFKYCCRRCERVASRRREAEKKKKAKENAESLRNAEKNNSLRDKAFLSPEDVSVLFNVSLPTVYRYFQTGLIKALDSFNTEYILLLK